jgi:ABC-type branched-subunit amino acid transport system ATPase component
MSAHALEVQEATVRFGGLVALDAVNLAVEAEEIHGIIGPNGAGKTTLFDVITGIYRPRPGTIVFGGTDITAWTSHRRMQAGLSRSFQTVGLAPGLTARDNVLATIEALERVRVPYPRPGATRRRRAAADELLAFFGLDELADKQVTELPLGATKLLELAKVFAGHPRVVLLDEPFAGLSTGEGALRVDLIAARRELTGAGVVIVEHDVPLLLESCDQLTVLDYGTVVANGAPDEVMKSPEVRAAYMGEVVEAVG